MTDLEGYERLRMFIVEKAVMDYKTALRRLRRKPNDGTARLMIDDCERFFRNDIARYTTLDGETIMRKVREQIEAKERARVAAGHKKKRRSG